VIREAREYFVDFRPDCIGHAKFAALDLGRYAGFYVEALLQGGNHRHIEALFNTFAAGLRAGYGKLPVSGFPRITPRRRKNNDNRTGSALSTRAATGSG
jgi:hypothetical protein